MKKIFRIILIIILSIIILSIDLFSQTIELELFWPGSMHSIHSNSDGLKENNGGLGLIATINGDDKKYNFGVGRIYFTNSLNDPARVDILQLMEVDFEYSYLNFGASLWKIRIYGYFNNDDPIILDMPPLPAFFARVNIGCFFGEDVFVSIRYLNLLTVAVTFFSIDCRF